MFMLAVLALVVLGAICFMAGTTWTDRVRDELNRSQAAERRMLNEQRRLLAVCEHCSPVLAVR